MGRATPWAGWATPRVGWATPWVGWATPLMGYAIRMWAFTRYLIKNAGEKIYFSYSFKVARKSFV